MPPPAISVCMPMYNASRYLRECIDSVLAQTFTDFEFLIVDDGSTDNSVEIVESYSDPRIRLIKRRHDYIASLNCLLDEAKGKYIARMDADDIMLPYRIQLQFNYMEAYTDVDILSGNAITIDEAYVHDDGIPNGYIITLKDLVERNRINHPAVFIRSKTLTHLGLKYDKDYTYAEDYKLWSELAKCSCKIVGLDVPVVRYRVHSEQISAYEYETQKRLNHKIQQENRLCAVQKANPSYTEPMISSSRNKLTIIMPFLNEGMEVVNTVASIREYAGNMVDIIVINDYSYDGIEYAALLAPYKIYYFVNSNHKGVAASRDLGVSICKTPYFLLLDAHMRFYESECFNTICDLLSENDRRLLCCQSVPLIPNENGILIKQDNYTYAFGAYSPFDMSSFWPDIRWNNYEKNPKEEIEQVEIVLGAGYATSVRYWQYLKGLLGLRGYGFDEAYISTKVWMEGGECLLLKKHILGHLYRVESPYMTSNFNMVYNSLLITSLLLSRSYRNWSYSIALHKDYEKSLMAITQIRDNKELCKIKSYYKSIFSYNFDNVIVRNLKSQAKCYSELTDQLNTVIHSYFAWIKLNYNSLGIGLRNGGLSSVMLLLSLYCVSNKSGHEIDFAKIINTIDLSLCTNTHAHNFEDGLCGVGWLLIGLYRYGMVTELPRSIIYHIDEQLDSLELTNLDIKDFNDGIGGILCYACARIYAIDIIDVDNNHFVNTKTLLLLRELATKALSSVGCDPRTYYHALDYLDVTSNDVEDYLWTPNLHDVVFCSGKPILHMGNGGYDLFSGVMRNWAFAIINKIKISQK